MTEHQKAQIDKLAALFEELISRPITELARVRMSLQNIRAFIESEPDPALRALLMAQSTALVEAMIAAIRPHAERALSGLEAMIAAIRPHAEREP